MLTRDQEILFVVGYKISFSTEPYQKYIPGNIHISLVQEISGGYENFGDAAKESYFSGQKDQTNGFLGNFVLVGNRDGTIANVISLKELNKYSLPTLQNGRCTLSKIHVVTEKLQVQVKAKL